MKLTLKKKRKRKRNFKQAKDVTKQEFRKRNKKRITLNKKRETARRLNENKKHNFNATKYNNNSILKEVTV